MGDMTISSQKSMKILLFTFLTYGLLVGTHLGEFWPLSIYPMFSKAGNPWTRALATTTESPASDSLVWKTRTINSFSGETISLEGEAFTLSGYESHIDFPNFVSKTKNWDSKRIDALRQMLMEDLDEEPNFVIYKVRGELTDNNSVNIQYLPVLYLNADTSYFNPNLDTSYYFQR